MPICALVLARYLLPALFLCSLFQSAFAESIHAAILPNDAGKMHYSDGYVSSKRFSATILNDTQQLAEGCRLELSGDLPLQLDYFATEPVLNHSLLHSSKSP